MRFIFSFILILLCGSALAQDLTPEEKQEIDRNLKFLKLNDIFDKLIMTETESDFTKQYLEAISGNTMVKTLSKRDKKPYYDLCVYDIESGCRFRIKQPIHFEGILTLSISNNSFNRRSWDSCSYYLDSFSFTSNNKNLPKVLRDFAINIKYANDLQALRQVIPHELLENLSGNVSYEVSFDSDGDFIVENESCSIMNIKNLKIHKKVNQYINNKLDYILEYDNGILMPTGYITTYPTLFKAKDGYVDLREKPNGRLLKRIKVAGDNSYHLFPLYIIIDDPYNISASSQAWLALTHTKQAQDIGRDMGMWEKVIYFPPGVNDVKDALIGYIDDNQIEDFKETTARDSDQNGQ